MWWVVWIACSGGDQRGTDVQIVPADEPDLAVSEISRLLVETSSGLIRLGGFDTEVVEVRIGGGAAGDTWEHTVSETGELTLSSLCATGERGCGTGFDVIVPDALPILASSAAGPIVVEGHDGPLSISNQQGSVEVRQRPTSQVEVFNQSGSVQLEFIGDPVAVDVTTSSGDIAVSLPSSRFFFDVSTDSGEITYEGVQQTSGAPRIHLESDSGDISIVGVER
ncbi:MAG TPA: hypothetical protein ENK18_25685 [Deltaproteobacteria bacterium]|nr:hypothetical protein [Deltaproteobacteria bacterium]